jgi:hypothetical protein
VFTEAHAEKAARWVARSIYYGCRVLFPIGALLVIARWDGQIGGPWWLILLPLDITAVLVGVFVGVMVLGIVTTPSKRQHLRQREADQMERQREMLERVNRNLQAEYVGDLYEALVLSPESPPPGMRVGSCSNPAHASQHPPHVAHDEKLGDYWCVGGFIRTDGTIPRNL